MAKIAHGGFTPTKGNPSGNGRDNQVMKDLSGIDEQQDERLADQYTEGESEEPAANVSVKHLNRNVNKAEDTNRLNQQSDL